jgi:hypothetical protein
MEPFVARFWQDLTAQWDALRRIVGFSAPLADLPGWMAPGLALGALLALALAAGMALLSLGGLLTALLVVHLVLDRIFGVTIALAAPTV